MSIDQTAIPKDLRSLNLNRAVLPPSPDLLLNHQSNSPRSRLYYYPTTTAAAAAIDATAFPPLGSQNPLAPCFPSPYPHQQLPPNGTAYQTATTTAAAAGPDDCPDDQPSSKKVKFLCSFGGKIIPRPSDGTLRYVGGDTRIIALRKDASFQELMQKMADTYGGPAVLKYQLPDEDLDALVSVSCPEDLENMMEEYDKLADASLDGSAKLRVFLFPLVEVEASGLNDAPDLLDPGQKYVDAVNGIAEFGAGIKRKESVASVSSTQNSDGMTNDVMEGAAEGMSPAIMSPSVASEVAVMSQDASRLVHLGAPSNPLVFSEPAMTSVPVNVPGAVSVPPSQTLDSSHPEQLPSAAAAAYVPPPETYVDPLQEGFNHVHYLHNPSQIQYVNPQQLGLARAPVGLIGIPHHSYLPAVHITTTLPAAQVSSVKPIQAKVEPYMEDSSYGGRVGQLPIEPNYKSFQALSQLPPLPSLSLQTQNVERYDWCQVPAPQLVPSGQTVKLDDCYMCQKALPHAHSDTLIQEQGGSGSTGSVPETSPALHSLHSEDAMRSQASHRVVTGALPDGMVEYQVNSTMAVPHLGTYGYPQIPEAQQHNIDKVALQKAENLDQTRLLHPLGLGFASAAEASRGVYLSNHPQVGHGNTLQQQPSPLAPSPYLVKQDAVINNTVGTNITLASNGTFQTSEPPIRDFGAEFSYDNVEPIEGMKEALRVSPSGTSGINEQWKSAIKPNFSDTGPTEGMIEVLRISPSETSGIGKQWKPVTKPNLSAPKELRPDSLPSVVETGDNIKPKGGEKEMLLGNPFVSPSIIADTSSSKPINQLPSSTLEFTRMHNLQYADSRQVSPVLGSLEPYPHHPEFGIKPQMPHEQLLGVPTTTKIPVGDRRDEDSRFYPGNAIDESALPSSNVPYPLLNACIPNGHVGDIREPDPSESLFSSQEPWQIMQNMQLPPPKPRRVASKEALIPRDSCVENHSRHSGESSIASRLEEVSFHQPPDSLNKETCPDPIRRMKGSGEELIKQELQAVAEGVAASILQPSTPPVTDFYAHETNESVPESNKDGVHEIIVDAQSAISPVDHKVEGMKIEQFDRTSLGFQITEDIGHLQIIKNSDLEELQELGSGTFGTVYHGKWRGSDVAIKRINDRCFAGKQSEQERLRADFWNEACKLADLHHPNVVAFYGVVLDGPGGSVATVTEYMVNGSLRQALQRNEKTLDRRKRLLIAMDVAFGMEYLHGKNIVHFDLKSDNLLVNLRDPQRPICKVGDLGLSKVKCQTLISGGVRGTLPWMAPELLNGSSSLVSEKVDVFSFAIVMWELLTGEEPYADLHYGAIIGGIVSNTLRPTVPKSCDPEWRSLMEKCWSAEPSERPSFTEIAGTLRSMGASVPHKGQTQAQHPQAPFQPQK